MNEWPNQSLQRTARARKISSDSHVTRALAAVELDRSALLNTFRVTKPKNPAMSQNKQIVHTFLDAFTKSDYAAILSCLTEDVEWVIPGAVRVTGKQAFDKQIERGIETTITLSRMTEEHNVVVAEGSIRCARRDGGFRDTLFCDVFVMQDAKIKHLTAYLMETKNDMPK